MVPTQKRLAKDGRTLYAGGGSSRGQAHMPCKPKALSDFSGRK
jgi:hypothetical protein